MKIIGLIGGTSYESMAAYYRLINIRINKILGGYHSAKLVIVNLDFNEIVPAFYENRWEDIEHIMIQAVHQLERAKVDFIGICCNTLHKAAPAVKKATYLPLLHILDPTGQDIQRHGLDTVALLGTKFTMDDTFHRNYLFNHFQINSITPNQEEKETLNNIIFNELCYGIVRDESRKILLEIIRSLQKNGAQGIVLGCTELFMLLPPLSEMRMPFFDTTSLHVNAIVNVALDNFSIKSTAKEDVSTVSVNDR